MKKFLKNSIIAGLTFALLSIISCDQASQEVSPVVSPNDKPLATFTSDLSGNTVTEGDTITYHVSLDKPYEHSLTFSVKILDGTAGENDIESISGTIPAFHTETEVQVIFNADNVPEESETIDLEVGLFSVAEMYAVHPNTVNPTPSLTINNYNDPGSLTVAFEWDTEDDDIDLFIISEDYGAWAAAASSDNPESTTGLWTSDPDGNYFITIDPYYVEGNSFDYILRIGHPDGDVELFEGTFDMTSLDSYTQDLFDAWGMWTYRIATAVNSGGNFTVTHVN